MKKYYYLTELQESTMSKEGDRPIIDIEIFRIATWHHPSYGKIVGDKKKFESFITNFENNVIGRELSIDFKHQPDFGAAGYVKKIFIKGDRLIARTELTPRGEKSIRDKEFMYFSPEYVDNYQDKETKQNHGATLMGGGLVTRPFLTKLAPIVMSEELERCFKDLLVQKINPYELELTESAYFED